MKEQLENYMPDSMIGCRKLWDALTGDELHSFEHKHIARACSFSEVLSFTCLFAFTAFVLKTILLVMCRIIQWGLFYGVDGLVFDLRPIG